MASNNITASNRMSAKTLVISENSPIEYVQNPKTGKLFFVCGSKQGYVSPALQEKYDTAGLEDIQYAEVSIDGGAAVPTLMVVGDSKKNVKKTLGAELLR